MSANPESLPPTVPGAPARVAVAPAAMLALLREVVRSPLLAPLSDEDAATMAHPFPNSFDAGENAAAFGGPMPPAMHGLDVVGWLAWCQAGLALFGERFPALRSVRREAQRFAVALAMRRAGGNISEAARMLDASRKVLRDNLRAAGLYPPRRRAAMLVAVSDGSDARGGDSP